MADSDRSGDDSDEYYEAQTHAPFPDMLDTLTEIVKVKQITGGEEATEERKVNCVI